MDTSNHHDHAHAHTHGELKGRSLLISIFLNIGVTVAQVIGGLISGSLSLLSDALHNFSDVMSLIISYIATLLAKRKADSTKTFGYKRAEILAAFVNAATLIIVAIILIFEAVERFMDPKPVESGLVIWLSIIAIIANGLSVVMIKRHADGNMNMKSAYLHLLTDMMASVAVLVGGLLMKYLQWYWVDPALTLAIAIYLAIVGYRLLKDATKVLMLFTPDAVQVKKIVAALCNLEPVKDVHHVHVWQLNDDEVHLEAHVDFNMDIQLSEFDTILGQMQEIAFHEFGINHINIQPEFGKCDNKQIIAQD